RRVRFTSVAFPLRRHRGRHRHLASILPTAPLPSAFGRGLIALSRPGRRSWVWAGRRAFAFFDLLLFAIDRPLLAAQARFGSRCFEMPHHHGEMQGALRAKLRSSRGRARNRFPRVRYRYVLASPLPRGTARTNPTPAHGTAPRTRLDGSNSSHSVRRDAWPSHSLAGCGRALGSVAGRGRHLVQSVVPAYVSPTGRLPLSAVSWIHRETPWGIKYAILLDRWRAS